MPSRRTWSALGLVALLSVVPSVLPADAQQSTRVGYIGCSMTRDSVTGYHTIGGTQLWEPANYGGGALSAWESSKNGNNLFYWDQFDALLAAHPDTDRVWWQLCMSDDQEDLSDERLHELALSILQQLRSRIGNMPVEASPQPEYVEGHVCTGAGATGPTRNASAHRPPCPGGARSARTRLPPAQPRPAQRPVPSQRRGPTHPR